MTDELERRWSELEPIAPVIDWRAIWIEQGRAEGRAAAANTNSFPVESAGETLADRPVANRPTSMRWWNSPLWPAATAIATTVALLAVLVDFRAIGGSWERYSPGDSVAVDTSGSPLRSDTSLASDTPAPGDSNRPASHADKGNDRNGTAPTESQSPIPEPQQTTGHFADTGAFSKSTWWSLAFGVPATSLEWRMRFGPGIEGARDAWEYRGRTIIPVVAPVNVDAFPASRPFDRLNEAGGVADPQRKLPDLFGGWL